MDLLGIPSPLSYPTFLFILDFGFHFSIPSFPPDETQRLMFCSGWQRKSCAPRTVTCLTTSPNGLCVLAGSCENIYLWEVSPGTRKLQGELSLVVGCWSDH